MLAHLPGSGSCARASARAPCAPSGSVQAELADLARVAGRPCSVSAYAGQEIAVAGEAHSSQLTRDKQQLTAQSTRLDALRQKLATLPASPNHPERG